jgi:hypothetical protein
MTARADERDCNANIRGRYLELMKLGQLGAGIDTLTLVGRARLDDLQRCIEDAPR